VLAVAAGVQNLQADASAGFVHRARDRLVPVAILSRGHFRRMRAQVARVVGREPAGHDERRAAGGALGIERGQPLDAIGQLLQPGMHRAHHDAVGQGDEAQVERLEKVGIRLHGFSGRARGGERSSAIFCRPEFTGISAARMRRPVGQGQEQSAGRQGRQKAVELPFYNCVTLAD
jgi:hypothetical protein